MTKVEVTSPVKGELGGVGPGLVGLLVLGVAVPLVLMDPKMTKQQTRKLENMVIITLCLSAKS